MKVTLNYGAKRDKVATVAIAAFSKDKGVDLPKWNKDLKAAFQSTPGSDKFDGKSNFRFYYEDVTYVAVGCGDKKKFKGEQLRRKVASTYKAFRGRVTKLGFDMDTFTSNLEFGTRLASEALLMADYEFDKYKSKKSDNKTKEVVLLSGRKSAKSSKELDASEKVASSINKIRDFINEPPNVLRSDVYSKEIEKDIKTNLKGCGVKVKILGKKELKKEKMNLFLSVNAGSAFEPQLVHLTYTPKKVTKKTKHVVLVGKGLVFDTGGYSLKPSNAMVNMKFDMGGSATVYGAFRAAALLGVNTKVTCILGITDNAVNSHATMPDAIVKGRNGKTVEILNTDAEGRLVLADCLDYACDQKPDYLIDAATLTGACLVALGSEVCAVMSNDGSFSNKLLKSAKNQDEYMWELPIVDEWREDMKSQIADLKNIGGSRFAGTAKAAAFLEEFVQDGVTWAHLDVAGIADSQGHLPYCPKKGGSGLVVRSLVDFIASAK